VSVLDPRLTPALDGLAALGLEGVRPAARYVAPEPMRASFAVAAVRRAPSPTAEQLTQLLHGEGFEVLERRDGWGFGQATRDGYVGWVRLEALAPAVGPAPDHWVWALGAYVFSEASIKSAPSLRLSMNALVRVEAVEDRFARLAGGGFVAARHLRALGDWAGDPAAAALQYLNAPYLWGGRDSLGIDCSGLVQQAHAACGHALPRDSDQQAALGATVEAGALARGDLVFWRGHVGLMLDPATLLHANAFHMAVTAEPLAEAVARIAASGGGAPTGYRRLPHG
jgi:cell wall-associated NlpC family hydrolase